ncbi:MAG: hypothetical protein KJ709_09275 [Nanoarchaeota archaeon]|nr:hypothetical protein [Nanoarchaeota archaeon]
MKTGYLINKVFYSAMAFILAGCAPQYQRAASSTHPIRQEQPLSRQEHIKRDISILAWKALEDPPRDERFLECYSPQQDNLHSILISNQVREFEHYLCEFYDNNANRVPDIGDELMLAHLDNNPLWIEDGDPDGTIDYVVETFTAGFDGTILRRTYLEDDTGYHSDWSDGQRLKFSKALIELLDQATAREFHDYQHKDELERLLMGRLKDLEYDHVIEDIKIDHAIYHTVPGDDEFWWRVSIRGLGLYVTIKKDKFPQAEELQDYDTIFFD